jgi:transcriptional regulator GlxA family with amidase domain
MKQPARQSPAGALVMLAFPRAEILDIAGPLDLLCAAQLRDEEDVAIAAPLVVSRHGGTLATWPSGIEIATRPLRAVARRPIDTLIVPGGTGVQAACEDARLLAWLRRTAARARRVVGVCTGAFVLAAAGLLDGRRATTHWHFVDRLRERHPAVAVEADALFVADDNIYTSAGITAGMDLALHLVEQDYGAERALALARYWLIFARRPGGQSQFSPLLPELAGGRRSVADLCARIVSNPAQPATVDALARELAMSPRHFARVFRAETGMTPARYVENARIEAARRWLEQGTRSLDRVAALAGLRDADHLRRTFVRRLGISPRDYRDHFEAYPDGAPRTISESTRPRP